MSDAVARTFHHPFEEGSIISSYFIPYGAGSTFVVLGLLDSLEDDSTPGEARRDATHARHLTNMKKFARDALLAARQRPLFVHLASLIMTGATQPRRLHEWLKANPPPPEMS